MPGYLEITDMDALFKLCKSPIIINDLPNTTKEERAAFDSVIYTRLGDTEILSNTPTCSCGVLNEGKELNRICPECGTKVLYPSESDIEFTNWMRIPEPLDGFITPVVFHRLHMALGGGKYSLLNYLLESKSEPPPNAQKVLLSKIAYINKLGFPRGYNNFIRNFDWFLEIYPTISNKKSKHKPDSYGEILKKFKDRLFPKHLALPSKTMLILKETQLKSYADKNTMLGAIDGIRTLTSIYKRRTRPLSEYLIEKKVVSILFNLAKYYNNTIRLSFCQKKGWFRYHLGSSKSQFCCRAVIVSLSEPHCVREMHIPWAQGLELLKIHICSVLLRRGWHPIDILAYINSHHTVYDKMLDDIMKELIYESLKPEDLDDVSGIDKLMLAKNPNCTDVFPDHGMPCYFPREGLPVIFQRNPSLSRLSAQMLYITRIKTDVNDHTISWSELLTKGPNADYDGDAMHFYMVLGKKHYDAARLLETQFGIHDKRKLGRISRDASLPDVVVSTIANWCNYER